MPGLFKKKSGPDFSKLENNDISISGIKFHFSVPGNGSKKWGLREAIPSTFNLYDDDIYKDVEFNAKQDLSLEYIRRTWSPITTQIWDYFGYFWQGIAGNYGSITTRWKIIKPKHFNQSIGDISKLKDFLTRYYSEFYNGPDGWNTNKKKQQLEAYGNLDNFERMLDEEPSDYETVNINSTEWLTYSLKSNDGDIKEKFYVLPLSEQYYISVSFNFTIANDHDGGIKLAQLKAADKIASYMKVSLPS